MSSFSCQSKRKRLFKLCALVAKPNLPRNLQALDFNLMSYELFSEEKTEALLFCRRRRRSMHRRESLDVIDVHGRA